MTNAETLVVIIALWVPFLTAHYVYRKFTAEYRRYLAEREADREIENQILEGGTTVPPREGREK